MHANTKKYTRNLNQFYLKHSPLWESDHEPEGFEWIDADNNEQSIISFIRKDKDDNYLIVICNFTPAYYENYRIGVPEAGIFKEVFNSDYSEYGGSGKENKGIIKTDVKG
mgnify:FL=1